MNCTYYFTVINIMIWERLFLLKSTTEIHYFYNIHDKVCFPFNNTDSHISRLARCLVLDVSCLMSDARCLMSDVRWLMSDDITHRTSHIRHRTSDMRHQTSDVLHQTSIIRNQTSEFRHTVRHQPWYINDVWCLTVCLMSDVWFLMFPCLMYDIHLMSDPKGNS